MKFDFTKCTGVYGSHAGRFKLLIEGRALLRCAVHSPRVPFAFSLPSWLLSLAGFLYRRDVSCFVSSPPFAFPHMWVRNRNSRRRVADSHTNEVKLNVFDDSAGVEWFLLFNQLTSSLLLHIQESSLPSGRNLISSPLKAQITDKDRICSANDNKTI